MTASVLVLDDPRSGQAGDGPLAMAPARWNLAGFCRVCVAYGCQDQTCARQWERIMWQVCPVCKGTGYEDYNVGPEPCNVTCDECELGVVEAAGLPAPANKPEQVATLVAAVVARACYAEPREIARAVVTAGAGVADDWRSERPSVADAGR